MKTQKLINYNMEEYKQILSESLSDIAEGAVQFMPKLVLGILGLLIAWLSIRFVLFVLKRILKAAKVDKLSKRIEELQLFGDNGFKIDIVKVILTLVRVLLVLLFIVILSQVLGIDAISEGISSIFAYLPTFLSAVFIFAGGLYLASVGKKATLNLFETMGIGGSKLISGTLFYIIAFFVSITALNQAGIDTQIITSNFTLILGAFLFAAALGFGLGSKDVIADLLKMFYTRKKYMVGDVLVIGEHEGTVVSIDNISLTLKTKKGKVVVPIKEVTSQEVYIKE